MYQVITKQVTETQRKCSENSRICWQLSQNSILTYVDEKVDLREPPNDHSVSSMKTKDPPSQPSSNRASSTLYAWILAGASCRWFGESVAVPRDPRRWPGGRRGPSHVRMVFFCHFAQRNLDFCLRFWIGNPMHKVNKRRGGFLRCFCPFFCQSHQQTRHL